MNLRTPLIPLGVVLCFLTGAGIQCLFGGPFTPRPAQAAEKPSKPFINSSGLNFDSEHILVVFESEHAKINHVDKNPHANVTRIRKTVIVESTDLSTIIKRVDEFSNGLRPVDYGIAETWQGASETEILDAMSKKFGTKKRG